jgi:hypothetical protein
LARATFARATLARATFARATFARATLARPRLAPATLRRVFALARAGADLRAFVPERLDAAATRLRATALFAFFLATLLRRAGRRAFFLAAMSSLSLDLVAC